MLVTPNNFNSNWINQEFLKNLILDGIEESIHLEYKRELGNNNAEIAKDISSFANSDGGNIIYGIVEDNHKPTKIKPLDPKDTRETIDNIALTGIDPPLNIRIFPIDVNVDGNEGQVFVLYIPRKYPYLHYTKKNKRYYKRANNSSIPMERYEIEEAFKIKIEKSQKIADHIKIIESEFKNLPAIKHSELIFKFTISPINFSTPLFEINEDMDKFLMKQQLTKTPIENEFVFPIQSSYDKPFSRAEDYLYRSDEEKNLSDLLIRKDGIIIYDLHFKWYKSHNDSEHPFTIQDPDIYKKLLKRGLIEGERKIDILFVIDYFLSFLNFLYQFFTEVNYYDDINIKMDIQGIGAYIEKSYGKKFRQSSLKPIENDYNIELIPNEKVRIVKEMFKTVFNGFGISGSLFEDFLVDLEKILNN
ncbi:MAG: helix-turn-helix domain-containing protein [Promethearchaeota archaeon]